MHPSALVALYAVIDVFDDDLSQDGMAEILTKLNTLLHVSTFLPPELDEPFGDARREIAEDISGLLGGGRAGQRCIAGRRTLSCRGQ